MMSSKVVSPALFLDVSGRPMRFFLRPGPLKVQLHSVISAGGGLLCRATDRDTILLADPADMKTVVGALTTLYVSTDYIRDSVDKNIQLDVEDYRFKPKPETRLTAQKQKECGDSGRMHYTVEEDNAILDFISKRRLSQKTGGNLVWKEMGKQGVTKHSWQSMKCRFKNHLCHKVPINESSEDSQEVKTQPSLSNQNAALKVVTGLDGPEPAPEKGILVLVPDPEPVVPQPELTLKSDVLEPVAEPEVADLEHSPESKIHLVAESEVPVPEHSPESNIAERVAESEVREPEHSPTSKIPELVAESEVPKPACGSDISKTTPETNVAQMACEGDQPQSASSDTVVLPPASSRPQTVTGTEPAVTSQEPEEAVRPPQQQKSTAVGRCRLSPTSTGQSPDTPSAKKARVDNQASERCTRGGGASVPSSRSAGGNTDGHKETEPTTGTGELGILANALSEFLESDDETTDITAAVENNPHHPPPNPSKSHPATGPGGVASTSAGLMQLDLPVRIIFYSDSDDEIQEPAEITNGERGQVKIMDMNVVSPASSTASSTDPPAAEKDDQNHASVGPLDSCTAETVAPPPLQPKCAEAQCPGDSHPPDPAGSGHGQRKFPPPTSAGPGPGQRKPAPAPPISAGLGQGKPAPPISAGPGQRKPAPPTSRSHMFLFDNESQDVEPSQANGQEVAFSQLELEKVKHRIRELMKRTNRDLEAVTKALMKNNGDWSASLLYLTGGEQTGPYWTRQDDRLLLSGRALDLNHKYGEEGVAKRLAYLDGDRSGS